MATISPSQQSFIRNLLIERADSFGLSGDSEVDQFLVDQQITSLTTKSASALIDKLKAIRVERAGVDHLPEHGRLVVNRYSKPCSLCGHIVEVGAGYAITVKGEWQTYHKKNECKDGERPRLTEVVANRAYRLSDGSIALTYKTNTGRIGGRLLDVIDAPVTSDNPTGKVGRLRYVSGLTSRIAIEGTPLSQEEAARLGRQYRFCVCCAKQLTDDRSLAAGYGKTCAMHNDWHYPSAEEASQILNRPITV